MTEIVSDTTKFRPEYVELPPRGSYLGGTCTLMWTYQNMCGYTLEVVTLINALSKQETLVEIFVECLVSNGADRCQLKAYC